MNRKMIALFSLVIIIFLVCWVYFGHKRSAPQNIGVEFQTTKQNDSGQNADQINTPKASKSLPDLPATNSPGLTREQQLELAPSTMNVPINFYGRVLDQDNNPISGVRVTLATRRWFYTKAAGLDATFPEDVLETDADGRFEFANGSGDDIQIKALEKTGYEVEPNSLRGFGYTTSQRPNTDPRNPILIRMWKIGQKQELVAGNRFLPIIPDGRKYTFNFGDGSFVEGQTGGDLQIWVKRSADAKWGKAYDWSFEMSVIDGGIKEIADESTFLAPSEGYTNAFSGEFQPAEEDWTYGVKRGFFLKARDGKMFGRINVQIDAYYLKDKLGRFGINYVVNPSGSRILR